MACSNDDLNELLSSPVTSIGRCEMRRVRSKTVIRPKADKLCHTTVKLGSSRIKPVLRSDMPHLTAAVGRRTIKVGDHLIITSALAVSSSSSREDGPGVWLEVRKPSLVVAE